MVVEREGEGEREKERIKKRVNHSLTKTKCKAIKKNPNYQSSCSFIFALMSNERLQIT